MMYRSIAILAALMLQLAACSDYRPNSAQVSHLEITQEEAMLTAGDSDGEGGAAAAGGP